MTLTVAEDDLDDALILYRDAFADLNRRTVQRHLMTTAETLDVFADKRVRKYTSWDHPTGRLNGLSVMTNELEAWPLISEEYFEEHFPAMRGRIWYIGFVCAAPTAPPTVFPSLIAAMMDPIRASRGMGVLDYSSYVIAEKALDQRSERMIARIAPLRAATKIDVQTFMAYEFDWPDA